MLFAILFFKDLIFVVCRFVIFQKISLDSVLVPSAWCRWRCIRMRLREQNCFFEEHGSYNILRKLLILFNTNMIYEFSFEGSITGRCYLETSKQKRNNISYKQKSWLPNILGVYRFEMTMFVKWRFPFCFHREKRHNGSNLLRLYFPIQLHCSCRQG